MTSTTPIFEAANDGTPIGLELAILCGLTLAITVFLVYFIQSVCYRNMIHI